MLRDSLFDESLHVPLILSHPSLIPKADNGEKKQKKQTNVKVKVPVSSIDVAPTILDVITHGSSVDSLTGFTFGVDGASLLPLMHSSSDNEDDEDPADGKGDTVNRATVSTDGHTQFVVRTKGWKLMYDTASRNIKKDMRQLRNKNPDAGTISKWSGMALYDLKNDPRETKNGVADSENRASVVELLSTLKEFLEYVEYVPPTKREL